MLYPGTPVQAGLLSFAAGNCEQDRGTLSFGGFNPDPAPVVCDDLSANRQPHSGSGLVPAMQTFENTEYPLSVLRFDSGAVVSQGKEPCITFPARRDRYMRRSRLVPVFNRIADQVLE